MDPKPRAFGMLLIGIMLIVFGAYQVQFIWTSKSDLKQITGPLRSARTYVHTVSDRSHESQVSELIFYLIGVEQEFALSEDIGDKFYDDKFENILQSLKRGNIVSVWVSKGDIPQIFQIDIDNTTLLDIGSVQAERKPTTIFSLALGMICIVLYLGKRYPEKLKEYLTGCLL